jgi:hypothetical protein
MAYEWIIQNYPEPNLLAENIKDGVEIFGVNGNYSWNIWQWHIWQIIVQTTLDIIWYNSSINWEFTFWVDTVAWIVWSVCIEWISGSTLNWNVFLFIFNKITSSTLRYDTIISGMTLSNQHDVRLENDKLYFNYQTNPWNIDKYKYFDLITLVWSSEIDWWYHTWTLVSWWAIYNGLIFSANAIHWVYDSWQTDYVIPYLTIS